MGNFVLSCLFLFFFDYYLSVNVFDGPAWVDGDPRDDE